MCYTIVENTGRPTVAVNPVKHRNAKIDPA